LRARSAIKRGGGTLPLSLDFARAESQLAAEPVTREVDPSGQRIVQIADLMVPQKKLVDRFWTEVGAIATTAEQQAALRGWLRLFPPPDPQLGSSVADLCRPGFLGWRNAVVIKIRTEGRWVEYRIQNQWTHSERTLNPPAYVRRFL